ncbi:hypothetical protein [Palleronia pelagia]|uniref:Uncharacterized protein n=1 Tax=Palleronia pelagia TaxID=387096 RepID=A0A1H8ALI7_9RHOB|nr:hypothetical protein [Palleronia pelagia]SEM71600.1 hypothetical protein SAMN04488011_101216 [Palleronia pelagia]
MLKRLLRSLLGGRGRRRTVQRRRDPKVAAAKTVAREASRKL